jgi:hypothetical protein
LALARKPQELTAEERARFKLDNWREEFQPWLLK